MWYATDLNLIIFDKSWFRSNLVQVESTFIKKTKEWNTLPLTSTPHQESSSKKLITRACLSVFTRDPSRPTMSLSTMIRGLLTCPIFEKSMSPMAWFGSSSKWRTKYLKSMGKRRNLEYDSSSACVCTTKVKTLSIWLSQVSIETCHFWRKKDIPGKRLQLYLFRTEFLNWSQIVKVELMQKEKTQWSNSIETLIV